MSGRRTLAVFDGRVRLGAIVVKIDNDTARYTSRDAHGRKLGTFSTLKAATAAIGLPPAADGSLRGRRRHG